MKRRAAKFLLFFAFFPALFAPAAPAFFFMASGGHFVRAAEAADLCDSIEEVEKECGKISVSECQGLLRRCERYYSERSEQIEKDISKTAKEKKSLQSAVYSLEKKIKNLNYKIRQSNLIIKDISFQIKDTEESIRKTSENIEDFKGKLAQTLRAVYEEDRRSLVEILAVEPDLSDFFNNLAALEYLNLRNQELLKNIKELKSYLQSQKTSLKEEKGDLERVVVIQTMQKRESDKAKREKSYFLKLTEAEYQKRLKEKRENEKKAAEIKARIFELIGVPKSPSFGEALELARYVEKITGVRAAFQLAILKQESGIGKNVGQCYLKNAKTGSGVVAYNGRKVARVMKPSRDIPYFLQITGELGRDPYNTLVSCPMSYGWGGAMGPAQFIPATWVGYKDSVRSITGRPADPWNIKDAFLASALYLKNSGASRQTYNAEFNAALSYFAGPGWSRSRYKRIYERDYGYPVMRLAAQIQKEIEVVESAERQNK